MNFFTQILQEFRAVRRRVFLSRVNKLLSQAKSDLKVAQDYKDQLTDPIEKDSASEEVFRLIMLVTSLEGLKKHLK